VVCAWLFSTWSTKWSLIAVTCVMVLGLAGLARAADPVLPLALVILGSCGVISMLLPYAAENYPLLIRGRATGWVAACSKFGGLAAQFLSLLGGVPAIGTVIVCIAVPALGSTILIAFFGRESRGRSLGELDLAHRVRNST